MPGNDLKISARDLIRKTRKELLELAERLGISIENGTARTGIISALAAALREKAGTGARIVSTGRARARGAAARASTRLKDAAKSAQPDASPVSGGVIRVLDAVIQKTAEVAEKLVLGPRPPEKAPVEQEALEAAACAKAAEREPLGSETPPAPPEGAEQVVHGTGQAEAVKFSIAEKPEPQAFQQVEDLGEIPPGYGSGRFFITGRDPYWLFLYWDLAQEHIAAMKGASSDGRMWLQIHDVTGVIFDGFNARRTHEFAIPDGARNWYAHVTAPGRDFIARLGSKTDQGFVPSVVSRRVRMPPDDFSPRMDASFVTIPQDVPFSRLREVFRGGIDVSPGLAYSAAELQARGARLPFEYEGGGFAGAFAGPHGEEYRRSLAGSEEILERLRREALMNATSGSSWSGPQCGGYEPNRGE
jgi:hypothetical protein